MGVKAAAELMLGGKPLSAKAAQAAGLSTKLEEGTDPVAAGLTYTRELLAQGAPLRVTSADQSLLADKGRCRLAELEALRADTAKKARGLFSPLKIIDCVQAAVDLPFAEGLKFERTQFLACIDSPQRQGLIHAFFAEETAKIPGPRPRTAPLCQDRHHRRHHGCQHHRVGPRRRSGRDHDRARRRIHRPWSGQCGEGLQRPDRQGRMTQDAKAAVMARYTPSTSYDDIADVDLVIEAVFEDLEVKKAVFKKELDRVCKPGAVLATNTSYLDIDAIAAVTSRPQDVIGLHFFSPANIMKLLEIVVPLKVAADVVTTAFELAKKMKKVPVRAGVCDGFIGNRILATTSRLPTTSWKTVPALTKSMKPCAALALPWVRSR